MEVTKMKLPKLKMCCFCLPLSKGFLVWGYANMVYHALLLAMVIFIMFIALIIFSTGRKIPPLEVILLLPVLMLCINFYSLLIVIAAHLKTMKMLRNLFIVGTVLWIFEILYSPCLGFRMLSLNNEEHFALVHFAMCLVPVILEPLLQGYVLLLIYNMMLNLKEENSVVYKSNRNEVESGDSQSTNSVQCLIK